MTENLTAFAPVVRRDGCGVQLYFNGITCAVDVVPGFLVRTVDHYPVYSLRGEDHGWLESSPQQHNALFSQASGRCGEKLRSISQLIKLWRFAGSPPFAIACIAHDCRESLERGVRAPVRCGQSKTFDAIF